MQNDEILTMRGISKSFPGVKALDSVDFALNKGEIHALMGENGAGKSTLIKVLTAVYRQDEGEIHMAGREDSLRFRSPKDAQAAGISTVYQEIPLCPNLTVAENMFIGRDKRAFVRWRSRVKRASQILENLKIPASAKRQLGAYSLAVQQMIAIARAVDMDCKVLILDEPTSSLDEKEISLLFDLMLRLKEQGVGIIFVTHFLEQVYRVCDRITVLRNGKLVGVYETQNLPQFELVTKMMGKELDDLANIQKKHVERSENEPPIYSAKGLCNSNGVRPFDFSIDRGEVNGFTGLLGSGRSESVRCIFGADAKTSGQAFMNGKRVQIKKPIDSMRNGIGYLPEDRKYDGIIDELSVRDNIILATQVLSGFFKPLPKAKAKAFADEYIRALNIKTASIDTPVKSLSGGNQQKVILARWLLTHPKYLILDEPTRGIDVGTKTEIQKLIMKLSDDGIGVTFISSEIEEMLRICSRLIVMRDRNIVGELNGDNITQEQVIRTIAGGADAHE